MVPALIHRGFRLLGRILLHVLSNGVDPASRIAEARRVNRAWRLAISGRSRRSGGNRGVNEAGEERGRGKKWCVRGRQNAEPVDSELTEPRIVENRRDLAAHGGILEVSDFDRAVRSW